MHRGPSRQSAIESGGAVESGREPAAGVESSHENGVGPGPPHSTHFVIDMPQNQHPFHLFANLMGDKFRFNLHVVGCMEKNDDHSKTSDGVCRR